MKKCLKNKIGDVLLDAINNEHGLYFYGTICIWFSGKSVGLGVK